jgi:ribosome assembly protein 1
LKDLRERFAKVEIQASKPIVPFRETAVKAAGRLVLFNMTFMFKPS